MASFIFVDFRTAPLPSHSPHPPPPSPPTRNPDELASVPHYHTRSLFQPAALSKADHFRTFPLPHPSPEENPIYGQSPHSTFYRHFLSVIFENALA